MVEHIMFSHRSDTKFKYTYCGKRFLNNGRLNIQLEELWSEILYKNPTENTQTCTFDIKALNRFAGVDLRGVFFRVFGANH